MSRQETRIPIATDRPTGSGHDAGGFAPVQPAGGRFSNDIAPSVRPDIEIMRAAITKPLVRLSGEDWLMSQFAAEVGACVCTAGVYLRGNEVVVLDGNELRPLTPQAFRTWVETHLTTYRPRQIKRSVYEVNVTMGLDTAMATLESPQFRQRLLKVKRLNRTRLPILRADGSLELLSEGYDFDAQTLTLPGVEYPQTLPLSEAVAIINDLLSEFLFADARSKAVAVAGMVGLYAAQLLPSLSLRPCFIFLANAEGAGKTLLVNAIVAPTLGQPPTGRKADDDTEINKVLLTAVKEALTVLFFDNAKGHLSSESLEAALSAATYSGRKLGVNESITGEILATVFITGNGLTVSPDMRRRSLFCELHLDVERAEDRVFRRPLDVPTLLAMRPRILSALWAMVREWDKAGRPGPSRSHSAFPSWAGIVGGIVEHAGFGCPLETASVAAAADKDGDDMRALVNAMAAAGEPMQFGEIVEAAKGLELFEGLLDFDADGLRPKARAVFGRLLGRYDNRLVGGYRFKIEGKNHSRRYRVEPVNVQGVQGPQGLTHSLVRDDIPKTGQKHLADLATLQGQERSELLPDAAEMAGYLEGIKR